MGMNGKAVLDSKEERALMLKAGFTEKQIEALFLILNSFEVIGVEWQD